MKKLEVSYCLLSSGNGSAVNLSKMLIQMANNITMRAAVENKLRDQDRFIEALYEGIGLSAGFDLDDLFPSLSWLVSLVSRAKSMVEKCHQKQDKILESVVREHRERKKVAEGRREGEEAAEDLVEVLLRLQEDLQFELTNDSIKALN